MIQLYHHPFSRAAGVIWTLEEVGEPYELVPVDILKGAQKTGDVIAKNQMGKVPLLLDGDAVVTEAAAIAIYLADRYALGRLSPHLDDPRRGTFLRWILFSPSVIEPGSMAKLNNWQAKPSTVGWGDYTSMIAAIDSALENGPYVCGEMFTIADVVFGGTLRYMVTFKLMTPTPAVEAYIARINARPALQRADAKNQQIAKDLGLGK